MATSLPTTQRMDFKNLALETKDIDLSSNLSVAGSSAFTGASTFDTLNVTTLNVSTVVSQRTLMVPIVGQAKVGATAGWVITGGTNICHATLPAGQTSSTLVVPLPPLLVGATVTAVGFGGQVESAGNNVTLTMSFRSLTNAAADNTDAQIATANVGTLTADTVISPANLGVSAQTTVVAAGVSLYVLLTGTTASSTDIDLTHMLVTYTSV